MQNRITLAIVALIGLLPLIAFGLGSDHPKHPIFGDKWPKGLAELVNADNRVHGYFVNEQDVFFFSGDTAALNAFLTKYAELPDTTLKLVLHPGKLEVKSPWDKSPRDIAAEWQMYASPFARDQVEGGQVKPGPFITRVDVWLGSVVKLQELQVPKNVTVESGGEIEAFVEGHKKGTS